MRLKTEKNGKLAYDFGDSFTAQLRQVLADQRRELDEIKRKELDLTQRKAELATEKHVLIKAIMKSEQTLERVGNY